MAKTLSRLMLGCIILGVLQINAYAGAFTAFGPRTFTRGNGKPVVETVIFSIKNPSTTYTLKIYNGGNTFEYSKVSSAIIKLNGSTLFSQNDFNEQASSMQKQVALSSSNQLQVELRSIQGSGLTVVIEGEDNVPPEINIKSPKNGTYTNAPNTTVTGTASDSISRVNMVTVNGSSAALTGDTFSPACGLQKDKT